MQLIDIRKDIFLLSEAELNELFQRLRNERIDLSLKRKKPKKKTKTVTTKKKAKTKTKRTKVPAKAKTNPLEQLLNSDLSDEQLDNLKNLLNL